MTIWTPESDPTHPGQRHAALEPFRFLDIDWSTTVACSGSVRRSYRAWARTSNALRSLLTLDDVKAACWKRGDPERSAAILRALVESDTDLGRRIVLQCLVPGMASLTKTYIYVLHATGHWDVDIDTGQRVILAVQSELRRPRRRPMTWPADELLRGARQRLFREANKKQGDRPMAPVEGLSPGCSDGHPDQPLLEDLMTHGSGASAADELVDVFTQASRQGLLTDAKRNVILRTWVLGESLEEVSASLQRSPDAVKRERSRSVTELARARDDLDLAAGL